MKEWLQEFKKWHEKYKSGDLAGADRRGYLDAREQLASALMKAQGMTRPSNESARQAFRVAQALPLELKLGESSRVAGMTQDISRGGFSALLVEKLDMEQVVAFALKLPGGGDPLTGKAKVVSAKKQGNSTRFSFCFSNATEQELDKVETTVFDLALSRMNF